MHELLTIEQIRNNLRRTASEKLISLINKKELEQLALKYYGEYDKNGNLMGYRCPYSGVLITDTKDLVLEHIIPVSSKGGTILFNCIPTSSMVNGYDEKGAQHLLAWWAKKDYYSPEKLNKLLLYIFEAYDIVFKNHTLEEIENSYSDFESDSAQNEKNADNSTTTKKEQQELKKQIEKTGLISYMGFVKDCIKELKENNYDVSMYENKLNEFETAGIFSQIDRYTMFQNAIKEAIKYKLENFDRSELTFTLNINIHNIMNSMSNFNNEKEIYDEFIKRLNNLEQILSQYNIGLISYFEDLKNLADIDILSMPVQKIEQSYVDKIISTIKLCVADNYNKVIKWHSINQSGNISKGGTTEEKKLKNFIEKFYAVDTKGSTFFHTKLTYEELKYLCDSSDVRLNSIYIRILQKSIIYKIPIDYDDKNLRRKFEEIYAKNGKFSDNFIDDLSIEEQKEIYKNHLEIEKNKFISLIEWYEDQSNSGINPKSESLENQFIHSLIGVGKRKGNYYSFNINLSIIQLKYLHDSNDIRLFSFYIKRLQKSIIYKIPMEYEDEELRTKFEEIYTKTGKFSDNFIDDLPIEEQKEIYKNHPEIEKSKFISLVEWYENKDNYGKNQPGKGKDFDIYGNSLLNYYNKLFQVSKSKNQYCFNINLSIEQMNYLKNSNDIRLKIIYIERLKKAKEYNIKLNDVEDKNITFNSLSSINNNYILELPIEEQRQIYETHPEIKKSNFILLLYWYENEENLDKFMPRNNKDSDDDEKKLNRFYTTLITPYFGKRGNSFECNLSEEQLKYLCNSEDIRLKLIYIKILQKSIIYNIPIRYVDERLKVKILNIYTNAKEFSDNFIDDLSIEEQKNIYYNNPNLEKSLFISLIEWYENSSNSQIIYPRQRVDFTDDGKDLGVFLQQLKSPRKYKDRHSFGKKLSYSQLKYLHDSDDVRMNKLYNDILQCAIDNDIRIAYYPDEFKKGVSMS